MRKRLLLPLLTILCALGGINSHAETKTITITKNSWTATGSSYTTVDFSVDEIGFSAKNVIPDKAQIKVNATGSSAFCISNTTAIPNITKIELNTNIAPKGTWVVGVGDTKFTAPVSATAANAVTANGTNTKILTFDVSDKGDNLDFFHLSLSAKGGGTVQLTSLTITYEEAGDPSKTDVELDWGVTELKVEVGETFIAPTLAITPQEAKDVITYSSSNESVATITNGELKLIGFGTAEITAEIKDNDTYNNASATYTLKYSKKDPKLYFEREVRYGKLGVGVVWEAAKHIGDGTVTYASSNPEIVAVNATTGQILPEDVKAVGTVTITATAAATETYAEATADYEIVIQDPSSAETSGGQFMFDFQVKDPYGMTSNTGSTTDDFDTEDKTITGDKVSLVLKGKRRSYGSSSYDLRFSKGASFTILVPAASYLIEKITINTTADFTISQGSTSTGEGDEKGLKIWSPGSEQINEVTFTWPSNADGTAKVKTITVVYKNKNADLQIADLSFTQTVYNTTVGVETEVNAVNNPNNVATTYSIDCLNPDEYTLTEADGKLAITVDKVGVYTLRAKSDATDTYLPGIAILRLNVFPQVDFLMNGGPTTPVENFIDLPEGGGNIAFGELPVTVDLYYLDEVSEPAAPAALAELDKNDFNLYDGTPVEFANPGTLHYFMRYADAYDSPIYSLGVKVNGQSSGIENVAAEATDAPVEYFNLQGIRVENPANGLYIRRQGNTASKVIVK